MGSQLLAGVLLVAFGFAALVFFGQRSVLYPRRAPPRHDATRAVPDLERLAIGEVEGWMLPPRGARGPAPALVFAHGNGELIDDWLLDFEVPRSWGLGVLLVEFPGYGRSGGAPSEASITRTLVGAWDALAARPDVRRDAIVGYGRSLGGAAMCQLAARRELAALVLESTFTSVRPLARRMGVPGWLVRDRFESVPAVRAFAGPVLLVHGTRDAIVPFRHAEELRDAARSAKLHPLPCGHNDCPRPWDAIRAFLVEAGILGAAAR